jgi:hypothetical protein
MAEQNGWGPSHGGVGGTSLPTSGKALTQLEKLFQNFTELTIRLQGLNARLTNHADKLVGTCPEVAVERGPTPPDQSLWDAYRRLETTVETLEATGRRFDEGN